MKFSINQNEFNTSLGVVSKGAATRSTLPILSGILLKAQNNMLVLESTDMDQSIWCNCSALIEEEGETVVPARLISEVVKNLPDAAIHFNFDGEAATILCDTSSFSLKTLDPADFPGFPSVDETDSVVLPFKAFSTMVKRVSRVVSRDESRPILSGVLIEVKDQALKMVATDSYRLALETTPLENPCDDFSAVVSGSFLNELASLTADHETIRLSLSENQVVAEYGNYHFINRRIEGNYPDYNQILSPDYQTRATFNIKQLTDSVKRVSLVSNNVSPVRFDLNQASQTTQVSSTSQDVGAAQETISSAIEGEDTQIFFNAHYLMDGLLSLSGNDVHLDLQGNMKPGVFRTVEGSFIYLIMPVRPS